MTKTKTIIKGTGIRCKGNVGKDKLVNSFEQVPSTIYSYLEFGLISGNELAVYLMLIKNDNTEIGYAFPTTEQLAIWTGLGDKTVKNATKKLQEVGLIKKEKAYGYANKNIYYVQLPHEKEELIKQAPHLLDELEQREMKSRLKAEQNLQRLGNYNSQRQAENDLVSLL